MYKIIATDDFIDVIKGLSLRHIDVLSKSFVSIKKLDGSELQEVHGNCFLYNLLEQIRNEQEVHI